MSTDPLISVIVPVYNVEKYLDRCIQSIIAQTYKNLEIILVDDGSPDNCPAICDAWAQRDARIRVIHKKNGGLSDARNAGLEIAKGDYIGFVDSDDAILPEMYQKLLDALQKTNADLAICSYEYVDESSGKIICSFSPMRNELLDQKQALAKLENDSWWYYVVAWNKLYTRKSLQNVSFPVGKIHEDQFIIHKVISNCNRIVCIEEKLYRYMQRTDSIMGQKISIKHLDDVEALCDRYDYYKAHQMTELYAGVLEIMNSEYNVVRESLTGHWLGLSGWKRLHEIDRMFRTRYFEQNKNVSLEKRIRYSIPDVSFLVRKVYHKLHVRRVLRIAKKLVRYLPQRMGKDFLLLDTPTHGNLGDHAIVMAEQQVLREVRPNASWLELSASLIDRDERFYALLTPMNQNILVHGGGFLGELWPDEEYRFRRIIKAFHRNKIIVFPQTVTFDLTTEEGRQFLKESQEIYSAHPDLTIFVREKKSYAFMQQYFPTVKCLLVPDIVTLLDVPTEQKKRKGILFCVRHDIEKTLDSAALQKMQEVVKEKHPDEPIEFTDTVVPNSILPKDREMEVQKKLNQFAGAKLIVTDRLHGMIFAALTNTPCIAMSNSNGKVQAVYEWIRQNPYIKFAHSVEEFQQHLETLELETGYHYNKALVNNEFVPLYEELRKV